MDLIQALLAHGANVNVAIEEAAAVSHQARSRRRYDARRPEPRRCCAPPKRVMPRRCRLLLAKGADPKLPTRCGITPLMAAAGLGTKEEDTTARKKTEAEAIASIKLCLDAGVDVNAADNQGDTALHGAAQKGWDQVVQFLVDHGAKLDVKDKRGRTPLDAAMGLMGNGGFDGSRPRCPREYGGAAAQVDGGSGSEGRAISLRCS